MQITPMGQVIVRNSTKSLIGHSCCFGQDRWVGITIHPNGLVCFDESKLSTKLWVMHPQQRKELRSMLASMLWSARQLKGL